MNKSLNLLFLLLASCYSQAENYPRLAESRDEMIAKYDLAEALYSELVQYPEYFEFQYIDGSLCAKPSKSAQCMPLTKENEIKIFPLFQALPLHLTQMTQEGLVSYIAFEECASLQCVIDAVRYINIPNAPECKLRQVPTKNSECLVPTKGSWYIRYQFLNPINA
jgi:hypothetical protein